MMVSLLDKNDQSASWLKRCTLIGLSWPRDTELP